MELEWWEIVAASAVTGAFVGGLLQMVSGMLQRRSDSKQQRLERRRAAYSAYLLELNLLPATWEDMANRILTDGGSTGAAVTRHMAPARTAVMLSATDPVREAIKRVHQALDQTKLPEDKTYEDHAQLSQDLHERYMNTVVPLVVELSRIMQKEVG